MGKHVKESDWNTFRDNLEDWRERYLETTTKQIIDLLQDEDQSPTERFWKAEERINKEAKILRHCLDGYSRSNMPLHVSMMYQYGMVDEEDMEQFSDKLRDQTIR